MWTYCKKMSAGNLCLSCGQKNVELKRLGEKGKDEYLKYKCDNPRCGKEGKIKITKDELKKKNTTIYKDFIKQQFDLKNALAAIVPPVPRSQKFRYIVKVILHSEVIAKQGKFKTAPISSPMHVTIGSAGIGNPSVVSGSIARLGPNETNNEAIKQIRKENPEFGKILRTHAPTELPLQTYSGRQKDDTDKDPNGIFLYFSDGPLYRALQMFYISQPQDFKDQFEIFGDGFLMLRDQLKLNESGASLTNPTMQQFIMYMIGYWNQFAVKLPNADLTEINKEKESFEAILYLVCQNFDIEDHTPINTNVVLSFFEMLDKLASPFCYEYEDATEIPGMKESLLNPAKLILYTCMGLEEDGKCVGSAYNVKTPNPFTDENRILSGISSLASSASASRNLSRNPSTVPSAGGGSALGTIDEGDEPTPTWGGGKRTKRRRKKGKRRKTLRKKF